MVKEIEKGSTGFARQDILPLHQIIPLLQQLARLLHSMYRPDSLTMDTFARKKLMKRWMILLCLCSSKPAFAQSTVVATAKEHLSKVDLKSENTVDYPSGTLVVGKHIVCFGARKYAIENEMVMKPTALVYHIQGDSASFTDGKVLKKSINSSFIDGVALDDHHFVLATATHLQLYAITDGKPKATVTLKATSEKSENDELFLALSSVTQEEGYVIFAWSKVPGIFKPETHRSVYTLVADETGKYQFDRMEHKTWSRSSGEISDVVGERTVFKGSKNVFSAICPSTQTVVLCYEANDRLIDKKSAYVRLDWMDDETNELKSDQLDIDVLMGDLSVAFDGAPEDEGYRYTNWNIAGFHPMGDNKFMLTISLEEWGNMRRRALAAFIYDANSSYVSDKYYYPFGKEEIHSGNNYSSHVAMRTNYAGNNALHVFDHYTRKYYVLDYQVHSGTFLFKNRNSINSQSQSREPFNQWIAEKDCLFYSEIYGTVIGLSVHPRQANGFFPNYLIVEGYGDQKIQLFREK